MAKKPTTGLSHHQRDKLLVGLLLTDIVTAVNTALHARRATLTLVYEDHFPQLFIEMPGIKREGWMVLNVKGKICFGARPQHPDLLAIVNDITERLEKLDAWLSLAAEKKPNTKTRCKLQVNVRGSLSAVLTLTDVFRGGTKATTQFELPKALK